MLNIPRPSQASFRSFFSELILVENAPTLINEFLSSKQPKKVGVAMWTLGNIAGDKNLELNQNLIAMGFIEPTLRIFA